MIPTEVAAFLAKVSAVDNRKLSAQTVDAWTEILHERISITDAWQAARDHFATRAGEYLMPGHINDRVAQIRKARLDVMRTPEPPDTIDPDDIPAQLAWTRAYRAAIGDGHNEDRAEKIACATVGAAIPARIEAARPVGALVQATADAMPRIPRRGAAMTRQALAAAGAVSEGESA
jgi:hypothetical protein